MVMDFFCWDPRQRRVRDRASLSLFAFPPAVTVEVCVEFLQHLASHEDKSSPAGDITAERLQCLDPQWGQPAFRLLVK